MNTATASYPFDVTENGTDRVFTYKKAKLGLKTFFPMLWPSFILSCFLTYKTVAASETHQTPTEKISMAIAYLPLYTIIIALAVVVVLNLLRRSETFVLNNQGIVLNGTLYPYKDIHSLYIKSPRGHVSHNLSGTSTGFMVVSNDRVQTIGLAAAGTVATATSGAVGAATQLSGAAGRGIANSIRNKSYKICFLFGKSEKIVAHHITENTALQLLKAINSGS